MSQVRLAILISGRGSNMEAILNAAKRHDFPAQPVLVLSNRPDAAGLDLASTLGVATETVDHKVYGSDREAFEMAMDAVLKVHGVQMIALAGFMRILTPWFVERWANRMVNIHPSLLPKYPGLNTHARAIAAGDAEAGCSVHWVTSGVDEGAVITQARTPIDKTDTAETLATKVLQLEHKLYPEALEIAARHLQDRARK